MLQLGQEKQFSADIALDWLSDTLNGSTATLMLELKERFPKRIAPAQTDDVFNLLRGVIKTVLVSKVYLPLVKSVELPERVDRQSVAVVPLTFTGVRNIEEKLQDAEILVPLLLRLGFDLQSIETTSSRVGGIRGTAIIGCQQVETGASGTLAASSLQDAISEILTEAVGGSRPMVTVVPVVPHVTAAGAFTHGTLSTIANLANKARLNRRLGGILKANEDVREEEGAGGGGCYLSCGAGNSAGFVAFYY